jgi:hypothetical protein
VLVFVDDCYLLSDATHPSRILAGEVVRGSTVECSVDSVIAAATRSC